ncbi:hypothetical protein [Kitasatospora sp. NPDC058218]
MNTPRIALATGANQGLGRALAGFGKVLPWRDGTPPTEQDRLLVP